MLISAHTTATLWRRRLSVVIWLAVLVATLPAKRSLADTLERVHAADAEPTAASPFLDSVRWPEASPAIRFVPRYDPSGSPDAYDRPNAPEVLPLSLPRSPGSAAAAVSIQVPLLVTTDFPGIA